MAKYILNFTLMFFISIFISGCGSSIQIVNHTYMINDVSKLDLPNSVKCEVKDIVGGQLYFSGRPTTFSGAAFSHDVDLKIIQKNMAKQVLANLDVTSLPKKNILIKSYVSNYEYKWHVAFKYTADVTFDLNIEVFTDNILVKNEKIQVKNFVREEPSHDYSFMPLPIVVATLGEQAKKMTLLLNYTTAEAIHEQYEMYFPKMIQNIK